MSVISTLDLRRHMTTTTRLFRWGPHYMLGVKTIDFQHEQLGELLNQLNAAFLAGSRATERALLGKMVDAVKEHFQTEEEIMERAGYPDFEAHKFAHDFLAAQVVEFQQEFNARRSNLSESMMKYLKDWLRDHMLVADKKLGRFLKTNEISE